MRFRTKWNLMSFNSERKPRKRELVSGRKGLEFSNQAGDSDKCILLSVPKCNSTRGIAMSSSRICMLFQCDGVPVFAKIRIFNDRTEHSFRSK